jgi:hypothetical protein
MGVWILPKLLNSRVMKLLAALDCSRRATRFIDNPPAFVRLPSTMGDKVCLTLEPFSTFYAIVPSEARKIFGGFGALELGEMLGRNKI